MAANNATIMGTAAARDNLAELVSRVGYGRELVVLERRGKPLAALISLEDLRLYRDLLERLRFEDEDAAAILSALDFALSEASNEPGGEVLPFERKP